MKVKRYKAWATITQTVTREVEAFDEGDARDQIKGQKAADWVDCGAVTYEDVEIDYVIEQIKKSKRPAKEPRRG